MKEFDTLIGSVTKGEQKKLVDVAINVYGKPFNTAATLYSLFKYSGKWIDKVYLIEERKQPHSSNFQFIKKAFGSKIVQFKPLLWLWVVPINAKIFYKFKPFRMSVRYQFAWEHTDKDFLFITHNDVLYKSDVIGEMIQQMGSSIGLGSVGQCWNCSAFSAGLCNSDKYMEYKPTQNELSKLLVDFPGRRAAHYGKALLKKVSWPLPECRLNEWTALINMKIARKATMPYGDAVPFGAFFGLDVGSRWFNDVLNQGFTVKNFNLQPFAEHAWSSSGYNGHELLSDKNGYDLSEKTAQDYLKTEFDQL